MHKFILFYDEIKDLTITQLYDQILSKEKIKIKNLKLVDLIYNKESMIGVYIFFDEGGKPVYVGKTGSRAILERLAGHFDMREFGFLNSFLCALAGKRKTRKGPNATSKDLSDVYETAIECKMVFIQMPEGNKEKIGLIERSLQKYFQPKCNQNKVKMSIPEDVKIKNI